MGTIPSLFVIVLILKYNFNSVPESSIPSISVTQFFDEETFPWVDQNLKGVDNYGFVSQTKRDMSHTPVGRNNSAPFDNSNTDDTNETLNYFLSETDDETGSFSDVNADDFQRYDAKFSNKAYGDDWESSNISVQDTPKFIIGEVTTTETNTNPVIVISDDKEEDFQNIDSEIQNMNISRWYDNEDSTEKQSFLDDMEDFRSHASSFLSRSGDVTCTATSVFTSCLNAFATKRYEQHRRYSS